VIALHRSTTKRHDTLAFVMWAIVALPLSCTDAWSESTAPTASVSTPSVSTAAGTTATARAAAHRCHSPQATIDACDDAVRWNPQDASLLIAMGDVQMRAQHPADAARAYRHALALAPSTPGIQQKISKADARLAKINARAHTKVTPKAAPLSAATPKADSKAEPTNADAKTAPAKADAKAAPASPPLSAATAPVAVKHFSNADPDTQSH